MTDRTPRLGARRGKPALTGGAVRSAQRRPGRTVALITVPTCGDVMESLARVSGTGISVSALREVPLSGKIGYGRVGEAACAPPVDTVPLAPGQGAPAVECAAVNADLAAVLAASGDPHLRAALTAECSLPASPGAGRSAPAGVLANLPADGQTVTEVRLRRAVDTIDGTASAPLSTTVPVLESHDETTALGRERAAEKPVKGTAGLMGEQPQ